MITRAIEIVDIDEPDDLVRLVDQLRVSHRPAILRSGGRDVAMLTPLALDGTSSELQPHTDITETDRAASRAAAGSWAGNVDFEAFRRALAESRSLPPKPPVDLGDFGESSGCPTSKLNPQ